ncbi:hypothetical protein PGB90_003492 [Kerria lacca]
MNCPNFNGNFVNNFQTPFHNNGPFIPPCNTNTFMNVPPPGYNGMNIQSGNGPFTQIKADHMFFPPPNYSNNMNSMNSLPLYPTFNSSTIPHSAGPFQNTCTTFPDPRYQNFQTPLQNNHTQCQVSPFLPTLSPQQTNVCHNNINIPQKYNSRVSYKFNRKLKQEKTTPFHCCDRGFFIKEKYEAHLKEHIICGKQGCTFTAHPKIVEKHINMQHRSGLFSRIVKGNSPGEIEKWISERKKQYPTKNKIKEKEDQKKEMNERGENYNNSIQNKNSNLKGRRNRFNINNGKKLPLRKFNRRSNATRSNNQSKLTSGNHETALSEMENCVLRNLLPFRGTKFYATMLSTDSVEKQEEEEYSPVIEHDTFTNIVQKNYFFNGTEDDDDDTGNEIEVLSDTNHTEVVKKLETSEDKIILEKIHSNSLDLLKYYDSVEEDEDDAFNEIPVTLSKDIYKIEENDSNDSSPIECSSKISINSENFSVAPESLNCDTNEELHTDVDIKKQTRKRRRQKDSKTEGSETKTIENKQLHRSVQSYKRFRPPTLLEKLLANDIRHERNLILQSVRYIVGNNFFDK